MKQPSNGFTLIELMIVMAIIGILITIATSAYQGHIVKTRRTDGTAKLMESMSLQEQHFTENHTYTDNLSQLGYTLVSGNLLSDAGHYHISAAACGTGIAACVTLTAAPQSGQSSDGNLSLSSTGVKTPPEKW